MGKNPANPLTKWKAINLLKKAGLTIDTAVTFSSLNKATPVFWANPTGDLFDKNWHLILNNYPDRILYLFNIPAKSSVANDIFERVDKPNYFDLRIKITDDKRFIDIRSDADFTKYLIKSIAY
jgi:hypothetical protein